MQFKQYQTDANTDGSINIRGLEIFKLCTRNGKTYDDKWFKRIQKYHEAEKIDGYLPSAVIGHEAIEGIEPESIGLMDNLKLQGKLVYADVLKVPAEAFKKMQERRFPNRSVELHPKTGQLLALSFLGKTRPFHKLPVMEFYAGEVEPESIEFSTDELVVDVAKVINAKQVKEEIELDRNMSLLNDLWWKLKDLVRAIRNDPNTKNKKQQVKKAMAAGLDVIKKEVKKFEEMDMTPEELSQLKESIKAELTDDFAASFEQKYKQKFKEDFGVDPETFRSQQNEAAKKNFSTRVELFADQIKQQHHLAPALVDGYLVPLMEIFHNKAETTIKFADDQNGNIFHVMEKFAENIIQLAKDNKLVVDFSEHAHHERDSSNPNLKNNSVNIDAKFMTEEESQKLDEKIEAFREKHGIETYEEAVERYFKAHPNG